MKPGCVVCEKGIYTIMLCEITKTIKEPYSLNVLG